MLILIANALTFAGLLFDLIGVFFLVKYGHHVFIRFWGPNEHEREGPEETLYFSARSDIADARKRKLRLAQIGFILLMFGLLCQWIASGFVLFT